MMPSVAPEADRWPRGWHRIYLFALLLLFTVQTAIRLLAQHRIPGNSWFTGMLHLWILAFGAIVLILAISRFPRRLRGYPFAAPAAAMLLAGAHAIVSIFDIAQLLMQHFAAMPAPVWVVFVNPDLALSLLVSMGIGPVLLLAALAGVFAVHLLLYAPVASGIASLARATMARRVKLPGGRAVTFFWLAVAGLIALAALSYAVPSAQWGREWFHRGSVSSFHIAPAELMTSAGAPPVAAGPPQPLPGARPLILIVVDAMRRDRMGVYDPALDNTPFLSRMVRDGKLRVYDSSWSTCTFSACGIMSLLSSRSWDSFGKRPPTLFDALSRYGYRGYAILSGHHSRMGNLTRLYGNGVELVSEQALTERHDDAWLVQTLRGIDFPDPDHSVLYLHMISAHAGSFVFPRFRAGTSAEIDFAPTPDGFSRRYDGRIRQTDYFLEQMFAVLREKGLLDRALVIITADHGERLGENGVFYHGGPPDFAATAVPLLVYDALGAVFPPRAVVSQIDVAPTFLRAVGGEYGRGWRGQALQDPARADAVPIGTFETTGVIAALGGRQYKYLCGRQTGAERIERIDRPNSEGTRLPLTPAIQPLLDRLRALHRHIAGPIPDSACRR